MKNPTAEAIRQGQLFSAGEVAQTPARAAEVFEPEGLLDTPPESVPGATAKPGALALPNLQLDALPIKGLSQTLWVVSATLVLLLGWQLFSGVQAAYLFNPFWGLLCLLGVTLVASLVGYSAWQFWANGAQVEQVLALQGASSKLKPHKNFGKAAAFIAELTAFYSDKPQAQLLAKALQQLPDYANDAEVIQHIERLFLLPLDREALRRIAKYASHTAICVAASPWATVDMLLSLLRNFKMINEVGQVYGLRPSLLNRYKLLKQVIAHLIGSGASELIVDQAIQEMGASSLVNLLGLRLTQGLGAGIYSAKIGLCAIEASRPVVFTPADKPKLKHLLTAIVAQVKKVFGAVD